MWTIFLSLANVLGGFSGLEHIFQNCHGCMDVVATFFKQDENTHLLVAVFVLMLSGGLVELVVVSHRGLIKIKRRRARKWKKAEKIKDK